jgi:hypothetical protein
VALDLQRLAPEVYALSRAKADLAIIYAYSSLLPSKAYYDEVRAAFEGAYFTGGVTDFISERQVESGKLSQYKVVAVPLASHAPDAIVRAVNDYVRNGGTVMKVGQWFTYNEYGRPRKDALVASGSGRLVSYPEPLTARAYRDVLDRLLDQAGAARLVRIEGPHGEPVWGVNVRAVERDGRLLVNLLNLSREPRRVQLVTKLSTKRPLNLIEGKEVEFPLTLSPLEPTLVALKLK